MSEQTTKNEVYETIVACEINISAEPGKEIRWLNGQGTEFEADPGTKFIIGAYIQDKNDVWHHHRKVIDIEDARYLVKSQSQFLIVKQLLNNPERLAVLFRHMQADGVSYQLGEPILH